MQKVLQINDKIYQTCLLTPRDCQYRRKKCIEENKKLLPPCCFIFLILTFWEHFVPLKFKFKNSGTFLNSDPFKGLRPDGAHPSPVCEPVGNELILWI